MRSLDWWWSWIEGLRLVVKVVSVEIGDGSGEKDSYQWRLTMKVEREGWVGWL